ncbi:hypothetical protein MUK42_33175 [Musa troglodytarum]|uniref:Uncharacterized protein n=1 Tax=Musa troglodytarum TaxID=320322 RepID=A0A9E7JTE0_9LILI|nr:hypothetical protein MUK42_33175 [Musa troglodytarum]
MKPEAEGGESEKVEEEEARPDPALKLRETRGSRVAFDPLHANSFPNPFSSSFLGLRLCDRLLFVPNSSGWESRRRNWFLATRFSVCEGFEVGLPSDIGHIYVLGFWIVTEKVRCLGDERLIWNTRKTVYITGR